MKTNVVTYQSHSGAGGGQKFSICGECEKRLLKEGRWPRDEKGYEIVNVTKGLHRGVCDVHEGGS